MPCQASGEAFRWEQHSLEERLNSRAAQLIQKISRTREVVQYSTEFLDSKLTMHATCEHIHPQFIITGKSVQNNTNVAYIL